MSTKLYSPGAMKQAMADRERPFEDEPLDGASGLEAGHEEIILDPSSEFEFDGIDEIKAKEARRAARRRERRRQRDIRTGKIVAACLCVCLIIGVTLAVILTRKVEHYIVHGPDHPSSASDDLQDMPTAAPSTAFIKTPIRTPAPRPPPPTPPPMHAPTESPTISPTPQSTISPAPTLAMQESYSFEPVADTYLFVDGPGQSKFYGHYESFLVQLGTKNQSPLPNQPPPRATAKAILQFDTGSLLPDRSRWPVDSSQLQVTLQLHHIPLDNREYYPEVDVEERQPIQLEVFRLPNTLNPDLRLETWTGADFAKAPWEQRTGVLISSHMVAPRDGLIEINVHKALFSDDIVNSPNGYTDDQVILLLSVSPSEKVIVKEEEGDRFYSRESDQAPQLILSNMI